MAKWHGVIGYVETVESKESPGKWVPQTTERTYTGDVIRGNTRWSESTTSTNDDLNVNCQISILADPFARHHFSSMKYIEFMGAKWKITSVDPLQYPRLILSIGGVYNG